LGDIYENLDTVPMKCLFCSWCKL